MYVHVDGIQLLMISVKHSLKCTIIVCNYSMVFHVLNYRKEMFSEISCNRVYTRTDARTRNCSYTQSRPAINQRGSLRRKFFVCKRRYTYGITRPVYYVLIWFYRRTRKSNERNQRSWMGRSSAVHTTAAITYLSSDICWNYKHFTVFPGAIFFFLYYTVFFFF